MMTIACRGLKVKIIGQGHGSLGLSNAVFPSMESGSARTVSCRMSCCVDSASSCRWYAACTAPLPGPKHSAGTDSAAAWSCVLGNMAAQCPASEKPETRSLHDIACTADTTILWLLLEPRKKKITKSTTDSWEKGMPYHLYCLGHPHFHLFVFMTWNILNALNM